MTCRRQVNYFGAIVATRIESILAKARITLADKDKHRWSDEDLLLYLDEGQKDFARHTELLAGRKEIQLVQDNPYFDLPDDLWLISRVLWDGGTIPIITHTDLDHTSTSHRFKDFGLNSSDDWEQDEGQPEAFLYDRRNLLQGKVYPIPDGDTVETYTFEDQGLFEGDGVFGVTVGVDGYTFNSEFGVAVDWSDSTIDTESSNSLFGVLTDGSESVADILIYYVRNPVTIDSTDDELETPEMFDTALKYYVIGHSFLNDLDQANQTKGAQQLALYDRELKVAQLTRLKDGNNSGSHHTNYRRVI